MSRWWALYGEQAQTLISYEGAVLVHDDEAQLRWWFPNNRVVPVDLPALGRPVMKWTEHPQWALGGTEE